MHTIVIADSLTNDFLSPAPRFRDVKVNVGEAEIHRLMGAGERFGAGVLPTFLRRVVAARGAGGAVGLILLRDYHDPADPLQQVELVRFGEHAIAGSEGARFLDAIADVQDAVEVIDTPTLGLPLPGFRAAVERLTGQDPIELEGSARAGLRFLLVGCHTDKRVLGTASLLRNVLGFAEVAVSPHLVASSSREAHFNALRQSLPDALVTVLPDLADVARYAGVDPAELEGFDCRPCRIEPAEVRDELDDDRRTVVETLCMHLTAVRLQPLAGGFSGSLLCLAHGSQGDARTEPMVVKVDRHEQMRRELDGYERVKDLVGKQVPTFSAPVSAGPYTGVAMELAAMEGAPQTLQASFELASDEAGLDRFERRLGAALAVLGEKLQGNTRRVEAVAPYRALGLHTADQRRWLAENVDSILGAPHGHPASALFHAVSGVSDTLESETALSHGDLNLANAICDDKDNVWFIDWTHARRFPLELDFAKLENDLKFVASKQFLAADRANLERFESYVLDERMPGDVETLPEPLGFVAWDFRFRKLLRAVTRIRAACFALKRDGDWLVYRVALLRYALHTLSFDRRQGRGECEPLQLEHALFSVEGLCRRLAEEEFHLGIPRAKPESYPHRARLVRGDAPWSVDCPEYAPPYHVDRSVLDAGSDVTPGGWADPEARPVAATRNPAGRTGLAGRGLLGCWGANHAADPIVTRAGAGGGIEILLGTRVDTGDPSLPGTFVRAGESPADALRRSLREKTGWAPDGDPGSPVFEGYVYDPRETDDAWVETRAFALHLDASAVPARFEPGGGLRDVGFEPVSADLVNALFASHAALVRAALARLAETGAAARADVDEILEATG